MRSPLHHEQKPVPTAFAVVPEPVSRPRMAVRATGNVFSGSGVALMPFNPEHLRELCARLLACEDDEIAIALAEQLRTALHEHIETLRQQLRVLHTQAP